MAHPGQGSRLGLHLGPLLTPRHDAGQKATERQLQDRDIDRAQEDINDTNRALLQRPAYLDETQDIHPQPDHHAAQAGSGNPQPDFGQSQKWPHPDRSNTDRNNDREDNRMH